jgi:hypothetical protein
MLRLRFVAGCLLAFALCGSVAQGHGIPLEVNVDAQGKLYGLNLFTYTDHDSQLTPFPVDAPLIVRGTAGFYPVFGGGLPTGTVLNVDAAGSAKHPLALAFWNGGEVLPSPVTVGLTRTGVDMQVKPTDTLVVGGALGAYNGQEGGHSSFTMSLPLDAPIGLYVVGFQLSGAGFTRSETFWGIANNGVSEEAAARGVAAITSAVPEPSTVVLGALGLLGLVAVRSARRK